MNQDRTRDQTGPDDDVVIDDTLIVDESIARGEGDVRLSDEVRRTDVVTENVTSTRSVVPTATGGLNVPDREVIREEVTVQKMVPAEPGVSAQRDPTGQAVEPAFTDPAAAKSEEQLVSQVRDGMNVVDAAGNDLGTVSYVRMGDPQAVTTEGEDPSATEGDDADRDGGGWFLGRDSGTLVGSDDEPRVEGPVRAQLMRTGFIKVGGGGLFGRARYAAADQIVSVSGDTVSLRLTKGDLAKES